MGNFVGAANLNTAVTNVPVLTEHRNATQVISVQNHSALLAARQTHLSQTSHLHCNPRPVTPVKVDRLQHYLSGYPFAKRQYLLNGFTNGFSIQCSLSPYHLKSPNLKSALDNPAAVNAKLAKELAAGRIAGPFGIPPFPDFMISPLGLVPKKTPSEFRLIHHLSFPRGSSVNDGIPRALSSVHYASTDDAIKLIKQLGPGCYMAKTDIASAFRIIPIHPRDFHFLGMKWQGKYYFDRCLPMGCSTSCSIFESFSTALEWIAKKVLGSQAIIHILDDFFIVASTESACREQLHKLLALGDDLGVPIAAGKTLGPLTTLQFAGITLDSITMQASLPEDKLAKCRDQLSSCYRRKRITLRDLQSLVGLLNFTCSVIVPGRAFLRRLIDLTKGIRSPRHFIRITRECKYDIQVWLSFLYQYNGKSFFLPDRWLTSTKLQLYTDAAGSLGYGAVFGKHWLYGSWPDKWKAFNITILELYPIVIAVETWGHLMANRCVVFFTDNRALVDIINKQTAKESRVMVLIRHLVLCCLRHNILFRSKHVLGILNRECDLLSRLQVEEFRRLASRADEQPTSVPPHLLPENWSSI